MYVLLVYMLAGKLRHLHAVYVHVLLVSLLSAEKEAPAKGHGVKWMSGRDEEGFVGLLVSLRTPGEP